MYKNNNQKHIVIGIIIIFIFTMIYFSYVTSRDRKLNIIEQAFKDIVLKTTSIIYSPFDFLATNIKTNNSLKEENKELKRTVLDADKIIIENNNLKNEIEELKNALKLNSTLSSYKKLNSTVILRNPNYWYNQITIDKGSNSKVEVGCAVVTNDGFIGRVTKVTKFTSAVDLVTNDNKMAVFIEVDNKRISGVITEYDNKRKKLIITGISEYLDIKEGSNVYTTGFNDKIPSGILIGKVSKIKKDKYDLAEIVEVEISAKLNDISYVTVLKRSN